MRYSIILVLCTMFCLGSAAQNNIEEIETTTPDSVASDPVVTSSQLNSALEEITTLIKGITENAENKQPSKDIYVNLSKRKFLRNHNIYATLDISPTISTDKVANEDKSLLFTKDNEEDTDATTWGLNFGGSFIFVPGKVVGDSLRLNPFGFGYNLGFITSFAKSSRYGTVCDFLLKAGFELGNSHNFGMGCDVLWGYGKSVGDVYYFNDIVVDTEPAKVVPYTEWTWERGAQVWMRTSLLNQKLPNTEMLVFARLMISENPGFTSEVSKVHCNVWKRETWTFGIIFRYKI